ncbi:MAG: hypothetical protein D6679_10590 [Candidatus Hydrogenedentota bacterium]|nr:MAG: hypothetical protein D6679_10590 [Candidatus Hydrogenedentota bacterium]
MKVAVVLLASDESKEGWGRMANALETVKELKEAGEEVILIFDGAATLWPGALAEASHKYHRLFSEVKECIGGACSYCAKAFGVAETVEKIGISLLDEFDGHPSVRRYLRDGYHLLTF